MSMLLGIFLCFNLIIFFCTGCKETGFDSVLHLVHFVCNEIPLDPIIFKLPEHKEHLMIIIIILPHFLHFLVFRTNQLFDNQVSNIGLKR